MVNFLTITDLCKNYEGHRALHKISFSVKKGDFLTIFGPNGAGKSTLLGIISTLLTASSGQLTVQGFDLLEEPERFKAQLGIISHHSLLYDHMSAWDNLQFFAGLYGVTESEERISNLLRMVELYPRRNAKVRQFSRGMRQRLSIARALINDPALLLLDEPFSGLDQYAATILSKQLGELKNRERTVIMVTHNLERGLSAASKVGILSGGRLTYLKKRGDIEETAFAEQYLGHIQGENRP